ncbi:MAG: hypothetical protein ACFB0G_20785 [Leptolyngbyaceae cyanobacterium]
MSQVFGERAIADFQFPSESHTSGAIDDAFIATISILRQLIASGLSP